MLHMVPTTAQTDASAARRPPILWIGNFLSGSGRVRSVCEDLVPRLRERGWEIFTASHRPGRCARAADMLATICSRRHEYALAHVDVYSGKAFMLAEAACQALRWAGKPFLLTLHGGALPEFGRAHPRRVRRLLSAAAAVTTPSQYLQEHMQPYRSDLRLVPNAVDLGVQEFRVRSPAQPRLIWIRSFCEYSNPELVARVCARLMPFFPELQVTMVGPDKGTGHLQRLQAAAAALKVGDRISIVGPVPKRDIPLWLAAGDIFLNTNHIDNTPVSVLEAMGSGLCVVSTDVGGMRYLVDDGTDALLVPPGDADAMAAAVRAVIDDPALAAALSRNAREKALQFDWSCVLPQWERLLSELCHDVAGRRPV